ncbi:MAG TPA: FHA domain-containing protein [Actinomycetes bacterium]|nr:FHA domain-containing protein [Actinomycetes bacterium]
MPPIFLLIVKVAFLLVLYLFVARAVRAVLLDVYGPRADRPPGRRRNRNRQAPAAQRPARSSRRMAKELVVNDLQGTRSVPLAESVTIGRAASCDLVVADNYVSNVHARIFARDGAFWLEDLGSTNGTYVNRGKVSVPVAIGPGDQVRVGKATLELRR